MFVCGWWSEDNLRWHSATRHCPSLPCVSLDSSPVFQTLQATMIFWHASGFPHLRILVFLSINPSFPLCPPIHLMYATVSDKPPSRTQLLTLQLLLPDATPVSVLDLGPLWLLKENRPILPQVPCASPFLMLLKTSLYVFQASLMLSMKLRMTLNFSSSANASQVPGLGVCHHA